MFEPAQKCYNNTIFKHNYTPRTIYCIENGLLMQFQLRGKLNFSKKSFTTLTTVKWEV